jgi:hypothetical protein
MKKTLSILLTLSSMTAFAYTGIVTCKPLETEYSGIESISILGDDDSHCALPNGKAFMFLETIKQKYISETTVKKVDHLSRVAETLTTEEINGRLLSFKTSLQFNYFSKNGTLIETISDEKNEEIIKTPMECQIHHFSLNCPQ